jgi:hypothetical protein
MFKRIALLAVTAGALAIPAAANASSPPAPTPLGTPEVKWVIGPTGHVGSGAGMGYEYVQWDDPTYNPGAQPRRP